MEGGDACPFTHPASRSANTPTNPTGCQAPGRHDVILRSFHDVEAEHIERDHYMGESAMTVVRTCGH